MSRMEFQFLHEAHKEMILSCKDSKASRRYKEKWMQVISTTSCLQSNLGDLLNQTRNEHIKNNKNRENELTT